MIAKRWFALDVTVSAGVADIVEEALADTSDLGTSIDSLKKSREAPVCISAFFSEPPSLAEVRANVEAAITDHGFPTDSVSSIELRTVEDADWLAEWKRHWQPTETGRFVVSPPWLEPDLDDKLLIRIEPNMAFGTGTHETTQLCLEAISELYEPSQTLLDVGSGTGVLSIAAALLGGRDIIACDTDADSVKIARENAALNDVGESIRFFDGSIGDRTPVVDMVCANLTLDVIEPMLPLLIKKARRYLLLSGILLEQETAIIEALKRSDISGPSLEIRRKGEWIAVIVSLPAS